MIAATQNQGFGNIQTRGKVEAAFGCEQPVGFFVFARILVPD